MNVLVLKLLLIPAFTGLVSFIQKRSHHFGGMISGLPLTAGPILAFLAIEQGNAFAFRAATLTFTSHVCVCSFVITYLIASHKMKWIGSLITGLSAWAVAAFLVTRIDPNPVLAITLGGLAIVCLFTFVRRQPVVAAPPARSLPFEVPMRSIATLIPLLTITGLAHVIGPKYAGIFSAFPIGAGTDKESVKVLIPRQ